ncbi:MAG: tetratricopeptide repeat protein [Planctomycetes bacterium]|nr:tetratricopeptide repeat protein [Planctomycetota bacterium]
MKTLNPSSGSTVESGFQPIPTRIKEVPPLIVERTDPAVRAEVVQQLGELGNQLAGVHRTAAEGYLSQGLYEEALPHLAAAATFAKDNAENHNQLGFVRYVTGDDQGALAAFERAIALAPQNPDSRFNLGMVLFGQSRFGEAEAAFHAALERDPNNPESWNNRGVCLHRLGRVAEARGCFERALVLDPTNEDARANLLGK